MCEIGIGLIGTVNKEKLYIENKINQVADCFFIIYKMVMNNIEEPEKEKVQEEINIAQLGEISFEKNISQQEAMEKKMKNLENRHKIVIGNFNLDELWEKKICTAAGRAFINASIKKKLGSKSKLSRRSLKDIPILSIAMKTPHMLEFENKKALFLFEITKSKNKKNIELSLIHI